MAPLKVLIVGGGIGGPALAFFLAKAGHKITIVEQAPALRATGAQIDLRAQGIEVVKKMGLLDIIKEKCVDEDGVALVNAQDRPRAIFRANKSGKGAQSLTSEFEIMRGDLVRILYKATDHPNITYVFGKTVDYYKQSPTSVTASFSDNTSETYDLLIGADGQNSRIRKQMLPPDDPDPLRHFGAYMAYWFMPRDGSDSSLRRSYAAPHARILMTRTHSPTTSQAYLIFGDSNPALQNLHKRTLAEKKAIWEAKFGDAGWQAQRCLQAMRAEDEHVFFQEIVQVRIDKWSEGRVGLIADAAHCASPMSGMGTTGALVGAYVLAGEINRRNDAEHEDVEGALQAYEATLRPFIDAVQDQSFGLLKYGMWDSAWAIKLMRLILGIVCFLRIPDLVSRFSSPNKMGWVLPNYDIEEAVKA